MIWLLIPKKKQNYLFIVLQKKSQSEKILTKPTKKKAYNLFADDHC